jgi:stalled ribosome rescue protein Dom34
VGDDRSVRWHARRHELVHAGADEAALAHLDRLIEALEPRPATVLVTANADGSVHCWLSDHSVAPAAHVGDCPALLPAIDELTDRSPVLAAIIDHLGADLFCVDRSAVGELGTVKGDHVQTHRHVGGDQAGHQRRADGVYERNAGAIAAEITRQAAVGGARLIVLSGDAREVAAVEHHLDTHHLSVRTVHAGARHESGALERLRAAVAEQELAERERRRAAAVAEFDRAVGRHTLAVTGRESTTAAIHEGRLATLLVARSVAAAADEVARDTLLFGGQVVVVDHVDDPDGIAGMLRYAVHPER